MIKIIRSSQLMSQLSVAIFVASRNLLVAQKLFAHNKLTSKILQIHGHHWVY
eukprot:UN25079